MSEAKPTIVYMRESAIGSILSDIVSIGSLVGLMFLNFDYWHGHWYVTAAILVIWFSYGMAHSSGRIHRFHTIDACIKFLEDEKAGGKT